MSPYPSVALCRTEVLGRNAVAMSLAVSLGRVVLFIINEFPDGLGLSNEQFLSSIDGSSHSLSLCRRFACDRK